MLGAAVQTLMSWAPQIAGFLGVTGLSAAAVGTLLRSPRESTTRMETVSRTQAAEVKTTTTVSPNLASPSPTETTKATAHSRSAPALIDSCTDDATDDLRQALQALVLQLEASKTVHHVKEQEALINKIEEATKLRLSCSEEKIKAGEIIRELSKLKSILGEDWTEAMRPKVKPLGKLYASYFDSLQQKADVITMLRHYKRAEASKETTSLELEEITTRPRAWTH